ncbi:MAG: C4-type zinc ribbon domain-containing protein, partial [Nitrospirota bacterium]|nr:C4-type zinc ribbon domain-containing protein [Nitrospirota bacterium]
GPYNQCARELEEARASLAGLEKEKRDKETRLKDDSELLERLKGRLAEIKTNKEYFAHLKEVETVEKTVKGLEDDILSLMEKVEAASRQVEESESRLKEEEAKLAEESKKIEESFAAVDQELAELGKRREVEAANITPDIFETYDKLVARHNGLAVVEALNYSCMGCHMNLRPQVFNNVRLNNALITCDYCYRILYWRQGLEEETPAGQQG